MGPAARVALVTGGSRGIGLAVAQQLHRHGWKVALTSRDLERAQQAARSIAPDVVPVAYEAQSTSAAELVAQVARDCGGSISALVNAAGISQDSLLLRLKKDQLERQLATNLVGPIEMSKAVVKGMLSQRRGSIVTIGSVVGSAGNVGQTAYSASKAGLVGVTKSLAKELGNRNIRVNLVEPGFITTEMTDAMTDVAKERVLSSIPLARFGQAEEVAKLVAFLVSDDASYITGQCIRIDGGLII